MKSAPKKGQDTISIRGTKEAGAPSATEDENQERFIIQNWELLSDRTKRLLESIGLKPD
jgi:hypothetical protein